MKIIKNLLHITVFRPQNLHKGLYIYRKSLPLGPKENLRLTYKYYS